MIRWDRSCLTDGFVRDELLTCRLLSYEDKLRGG
jgi:hypothetical protein